MSYAHDFPQLGKGSGCICLLFFILPELNGYMGIVLYTCRPAGALVT